MGDLHILINPHASGGKAADLVPALQAWAQAQPAQLCVATTVAHARQWLGTLAPGSTLALAGGDGTVHQMLPLVLERRLCLALVPQGSGNDLARALGVHGWHWKDALQLAGAARAQPMDIGWLHTNTLHCPFISSLTAGFDSAVGLRALRGPRWLRGLPRYLLATLRELAALQTWDMQVQVDGTLLHSGATLFASSLNTPSYGSGMPAVPHARLDDGLLDLLVAGRFNTVQTLGMLPRLLAARHLSHPRVHTQAYRQLDIQASSDLPLAADGEYLGTTRTLRVQVAPAALRVLRP